MVKNKQKMGRVAPKSQKPKKKPNRKVDKRKSKPVDIATLYGLTPVEESSPSDSGSWETAPEPEPTTSKKKVPKHSIVSETPKLKKKKLLEAPPPFVVDLDTDSNESIQKLLDELREQKKHKNDRPSAVQSEKQKTIKKRKNYVTPFNFDDSPDDTEEIVDNSRQPSEVPESPEVPTSRENLVKSKKRKRKDIIPQNSAFIPSKNFEASMDRILQSAEIPELPDVVDVVNNFQPLKKKNKRKQLEPDRDGDGMAGEACLEDSPAQRKKLRCEDLQFAKKFTQKVPDAEHFDENLMSELPLLAVASPESGLESRKKDRQKKKKKKNKLPTPPSVDDTPSMNFESDDLQSTEIPNVPEVPDECGTPQGKDPQKRKKKRSSDDDGAKIRLTCNDFYLVPWVDENEWTSVCNLLQKKDFAKVNEHVDIWRERVPTLPVGVEATAVLIRALDFEMHNKNSDSELRSLFSLAVVRFLNLISNLSAKEVSAGHVAMMQMAEHLEVPDWIVNIRHEVSHGAALPSVEFLHMAATTILDWLLKYYWTGSYECDYLLMDAGSSNVLFARARKQREKKAQNELGEERIVEEIQSCMSSLVACKIYRMRGKMVITDEDILKTIYEQEDKAPQSISTKSAMGRLNMKLAVFWKKRPTIVAKAVGDQLVFPEEFLQTFADVFNLDVKTQTDQVFAKCKQAWAPVFSVTQSKKEKYPLICRALTSHLEPEESSNIIKTLAGRWLHFVVKEIPLKALHLHEERTKPLVEVMETVMLKPEFVPADTMTMLLDLMAPALGPEKCELIKELDSIFCVDDSTEEPTAKKHKRNSNFQPFTVEEIIGEPVVDMDVANQASLEQSKDLPGPQAADIQNWSVDPKGSHYWNRIPIGAVSV